MADYDLDNAYAIHGPDEARALYGQWAPSYDDSFGAAWGYVAPREIATLYRAEGGADTPVLDIGAGTGLVAAGRITPVRFHDIAIYAGVDHPHAADRGLVMVFRTP